LQFGPAWRLLYKSIANATRRSEAQRRWCRLALRFLPHSPLVIETEFKLQLGPAWRLLHLRQVPILLSSYYQFLLLFEKSHWRSLEFHNVGMTIHNSFVIAQLCQRWVDSIEKERWRWGPHRASYMYGRERWLGGRRGPHRASYMYGPERRLGGLGVHIDEAFHDGPGETIVSISLYGPNISLSDYMAITYMPVLPVD